LYSIITVEQQLPARFRLGVAIVLAMWLSFGRAWEGKISKTPKNRKSDVRRADLMLGDVQEGVAGQAGMIRVVRVALEPPGPATRSFPHCLTVSPSTPCHDRYPAQGSRSTRLRHAADRTSPLHGGGDARTDGGPRPDADWHRLLTRR